MFVENEKEIEKIGKETAQIYKLKKQTKTIIQISIKVLIEVTAATIILNCGLCNCTTQHS